MPTEVAAGRYLRHPQFALDGSVRGFFRCQSERSRFPLGCLISWGHFLCALGHLRAFWTRGRPLDRCLRLELAGEALEKQDRWRANDRGGTTPTGVCATLNATGASVITAHSKKNQRWSFSAPLADTWSAEREECGTTKKKEEFYRGNSSTCRRCRNRANTKLKRRNRQAEKKKGC